MAFVWKELSRHRNADAVALRSFFSLDLHIEIDRAHGAIAEFLLDKSLPGGVVGLHKLVETIDQRIGGWNGM